MSDTATTEMPPELAAKVEDIAQTTKKGFDLTARLKNRGLRRGGVTLYLDEEKGPELGWAYDQKDLLGNVLGRAREGVLGEIDTLEYDRAVVVAEHNLAHAVWDEIPAAERMAESHPEPVLDTSVIDAQIDRLNITKDALVAELTKTGIRVEMRAVPPIIQKDQRRQMKAKLEIKGKNIPDDLLEEAEEVETALLLTVMVQSVTDLATGDVNDTLSYAEAVDLMGYLPRGQWNRLDNLMGTLQYTDAISKLIENQEDFS